jgi:iron complex outermembrane receptor protein
VFVQQYLGRLPADQTLFDQNNVPPGFTPLGAPQTNYTNDRTFSDVLPRFGFDYHLSNEVLAYVIYNKGFKSGGFDMRGNATANPATRTATIPRPPTTTRPA